MKRTRLEVVYEDNHLLVVNKPAGLATQGVAEGLPSMVTLAREYLKQKYNKPGNVYVGVVSRLDAMVSGFLVLARTSKAADRLTKQFQSGAVEKTYWALVERPPERTAAELSDWVVKSERDQRMTIVPARARGAQQARLTYRTLRPEKQGTLLEVQLHTGRKHQIRLQLAAIGCPIVGDRKYGSRKPFLPDAIALHCVRLKIEHPTTKEPMEFSAPVPATWKLIEAG
jgi:23S rRNA pseudouridine1911/1915/1917 synthase